MGVITEVTIVRNADASSELIHNELCVCDINGYTSTFLKTRFYSLRNFVLRPWQNIKISTCICMCVCIKVVHCKFNGFIPLRKRASIPYSILKQDGVQ